MKKIILGTNKNVLLNNINENNINNIKDLIGDVYFDFDIKNYGTLKNNIRTNNYNYEFIDTKINDNSLNMLLSHIYLSTNSKNNSFYGNGWKLNLQQYLKYDNYDSENGYRKITFFDEKNIEHEFYEKWSYINDDNQQVYVNKSKIFLDFDNKLKYCENDKIYEIKHEITNDEHLQLIRGSNINNFNSLNDVSEFKYVIVFADKKIIEVNLNKTTGEVEIPILLEKIDYSEKQIPYSEINLESMTSINGNEIINKGNESFDLEIDENGAYVNANYQIIRLTLIPIINFDNDDNIYVNDDLSNLKEYISNIKELISSCFSSYNECLNYLEQINIQQKSIDSNKEYISNVEKFQSAIKTYNNQLFVLKKESFETILKKIFLEQIETKQYFKYKVKDDKGNEKEICEKPKFVEIKDNEMFVYSLDDETIKKIFDYNCDGYFEAYNSFIRFYELSNLTEIDKLQEAISDYSKTKNNNDITFSKNNLEKIIQQNTNQLKEVNENLKNYLFELSNYEERYNTLYQSQKQKINDFIIDANSKILGFDGYGKLISIQDKFENKINIEYGYNEENKDQILSIVIDNKHIKFNYDKVSKQLTSIVDYNGKKIKYFYDDNNNLISIVKGKNKLSFTYENLFLNKIITPLLETLELIKNNNSLCINKYYLNCKPQKNELYEKCIDENTIIEGNEKVALNNSIEFVINDSETKIKNLINDKEVAYKFNELNQLIEIDDDEMSYFNYSKAKVTLKCNIKKNENILRNIDSSTFITSETIINLNDFVKGKINNLSKDNYIGLKIKTGNSKTFTFNLVVYDQKTKIIPDLNPNQTYIIPFKINRKKPSILNITYKCEQAINNVFDSIELVNLYNVKEYYYDNDDNLTDEINGYNTIKYLNYENNLYHKKEETSIYGDKLITKYSYNSNNQITLIEDSKNNIVEYYYDKKGNCIEQRSYNKNDASLMRVNKTQYDEKGNTINYGSIKNKEGNYPTQVIKCNDLNTEIKGFKNEVITYNYDFNTDELLSIASSAGGINNSTSFSYNYGLLTSMKHLGCEVKYAYDGLGRKLKTTFNGKEILWNKYKDNYNSKFDFDDYNFDKEIKNGFFSSTSTLGGLYEAFYYDEKGKLLYKKELTLTSTCDYVIEYTNENVKSITASISDKKTNNVCIEKIENSYNIFDNLISQEKSVNNHTVLTIKNNYDDKNKFIDSYDLILENETRLNYQNTYANDLLTSVTLNDAIIDDEENFVEILKSEYKYDALNRVQHQKITSDKVNVCNEYSYLQQDNNSLDLISEDILKIEINNNNQKSYLSETHTYEYDVNGNITSISDDETKNRYEYDELNRLIREDNRLLNKTVVYKYDKAGNILLKKNYDYSLNDITPSIKPRSLNEYIYDCDNRDRLISYDGKLFEYDDMGRPETYKNNELEWNSKGQLLLWVNENLDEFEYTYDSNGIRNKKIINGIETTYITNGTQILQMKNDNGKFIFHYILNKLVGFEYTNTSGTKEYLYIRNIQGDITSIIDTEGNIICTYAYDGYGNHIVLDENGKEDTSLTSIGHLNPFRYRGYYFDEESGLYYLNSRYYDPETGRFISPDILTILDETKGQINGLNLYMYCRNNPIMYVDHNGRSATLMIIGSLLFLGAMGAITNVIMQGISDIINGNKFDLTYYGIAALSGFVGGMISYGSSVLGTIVSTAISTGLTMWYDDSQGKAVYDDLDYVTGIIASEIISLATSAIFGKIVKKMNLFDTATFFSKHIKEFFDVGNKVFFGMLRDLFPYYLAYSLAGAGFDLIGTGIPEFIRDFISLKSKGLSWENSFKYAF